MVVGTDDITQTTDVGVVEERDDGRLAGGTDLLGLVCPLLLGAAVVVLLGRAPRDNLTGDLGGIVSNGAGKRACGRRRRWRRQQRTMGVVLRKGILTCSVPSSLRASLTLPILPAPIVLPRIHLPDWVGMEVRVVLCFAPVARASAAACMTGGTAAGPALLATAVAPAMVFSLWWW